MTQDNAATIAYSKAKESGSTANPHLFSSPNWYLHELGIYFFNSGRAEPKDAKMSRGYSVKASEMLFKIHHNKQQISFERIK